MNLEQKNTLFVVTLVGLVLASVAAMAYWLIERHVDQQIQRELERAHTVFVEAQKQGFKVLQDTAERLSEQPSLLAAGMIGDPGTIRDALRQALPNSELELLAFYGNGANVTGIGQADRLHLVAPQVLDSDSFVGLVRKAAKSGETAFGHALVFDSLLRLVAVPISNPAGGQIGVLLVGADIDATDLQRWRSLIGAEVLLYRDNLEFGGTLQGIDPPPQRLAQLPQGALQKVSANGIGYLATSDPLLGQADGAPVARVLLAVSADAQWSPYRELAKNALYFALLILLVAALLGIWISRRWLTVPVKSLARATTAIGDGDLDIRVAADRGDELGDLARSFNLMLERLRISQAEELESRQRFYDFAESSSDWLWETDAEGRFTYVSQNVVASLAISAEELQHRTFAELFPQDNARDIMVLLRPGEKRAQPIKDVELWITNREGIRLCVRISATPYEDQGEFRGYRGTARDITKAKNDQERLVHLANRDHLTGLSNRRRFMEELAREMAVARRQGHSGALLLIDLDHFKLVNDTAGHAAGDEVIVQIGGMLRRMARSVDLVARLSGDEFVIALINTTPEQAQKRAEELLNHVGQLRPTYGGRILNTSASVGIVVFPRHGQTPVELLAKADTAMYAAKKAGRNRTHLYSESDMDQALMGSQLTWKDRIHEALEADLFELAFQPIMPTRKIAAPPRFEVLVRMRAADGTLHMPGSFIPTAEQFGLIRQVDAVVVTKAVRTLAALPKDQPVSLSINLSGLSVGDRSMLELIETELDRAGVDHRRIIFEITESAACQDINRASEFIKRVQQLGCRIALDDFGVGFSSFSYLKHLQADVIKIDGSFIRDIHNSVEDQLFVKALVDVARGMGMQTTAEFVESEQAFEQVRALGVDYVQGFYVGKPRALQSTTQRVKISDAN